MKRLHTKSQNFLRSPSIVKTLVGHSNIKRSDTVYDIGAGSGIISYVLSDACRQVVAVEQDSRMITKLHDNLDDLHNVTIQKGDALTITLPTTPYKVFANIPFHLSSPILRRFTEAERPPTAIYLIVQKQFAEKLLIGNENFTGLLGVYIAPHFTTRIRYKLLRSDYRPAPAVDTVLVELLRRNEPLLPSTDMVSYREFVERCFSRQKYFDTLSTGKRPSQLSLGEWLGLFARHSKKSK
ncbi:methyltransferase domain-containing protein [Candidatus Mycosynbacter amalyticus]|uniref:Methyltransferase domain-containing protein n=1 Tax=Candidatus Mycosynbacter amalyticus TaxID=2665156 RepID=A0A857MKB4_9BACT|nr:rRNA adenine dimethyltransferase family protein [Candidatus Mycosynbacter amalyticus]QHN43034.1 methyltransferase domain-containing protein [Candidatus Mycosynbacter amalyticus]